MLLLHLEFADSSGNFKHALNFSHKKTASAPERLTVTALLPRGFEQCRLSWERPKC